MLYEFKKLYSNKAIAIIALFITVVSVIVPIVFMFDFEYEAYNEKTGKIEVINGIEALKAKQERQSKAEGKLSIEKSNEILKFLKSSNSEDLAMARGAAKYPGMYEFLAQAYSEYAQQGDFEVKSVKNANVLYSRNAIVIKSKIKKLKDRGVDLSNDEKAFAYKQIGKIKKPFMYGFTDHLEIAIKSLIFIYTIVLFCAMLVASQIFSNERKYKMDLLLASLGRRKVAIISYKKVIAVIVYVILLALIPAIVVLGICMVIFGTGGWDVSIHVVGGLFSVPYNLSMGVFVITAVVSSILATVAVAGVTLLIDAMLMRPFVSLVLSAAIMSVPMLLKDNEILPSVIKKWALIQPINTSAYLDKITSMFSFGISEHRMFVFPSSMVLSIILAGIGTFFAVHIFARRISK